MRNYRLSIPVLSIAYCRVDDSLGMRTGCHTRRPLRRRPAHLPSNRQLRPSNPLRPPTAAPQPTVAPTAAQAAAPTAAPTVAPTVPPAVCDALPNSVTVKAGDLGSADNPPGHGLCPLRRRRQDRQKPPPRSPTAWAR